MFRAAGRDTEQTLVNWNVVGRNLQALAVPVQREWERPIG